ncbi:hypothetical protein FACS189434_11200 [Bacteroidia bacterium]|nr:hypothetical protein FACS189434_11200 [Bacteroidia bacterium]
MKKNFIYLSMLLFAAMITVSCGKDHNDEPPLVGKWTFAYTKTTEFEFSSSSSYSNAEKEKLKDYTEDYFRDFKLTSSKNVEFMPNGEILSDNTLQGTYENTGKNLKLTFGSNIYNCPYSIKDNQLHIIFDIYKYWNKNGDLTGMGISAFKLDIVYEK